MHEKDSPLKPFKRNKFPFPGDDLYEITLQVD